MKPFNFISFILSEGITTQMRPLHPLDVFPYSASNFATLRHIFSSMCGMYKKSGAHVHAKQDLLSPKKVVELLGVLKPDGWNWRDIKESRTGNISTYIFTLLK